MRSGGALLTMKKLYGTHDRLMAFHIKNILEENGILRNVRNVHNVDEVPGEIHNPEIWIYDDARFSQAKEILNEVLYSDASTGGTWKCSCCDEEHESQFSECWQCGAPRPL